MDCDILHMFLLERIFIAIICYHYSKHRLNKKNIGTLTIKKGQKWWQKCFTVLCWDLAKWK